MKGDIFCTDMYVYWKQTVLFSCYHNHYQTQNLLWFILMVPVKSLKQFMIFHHISDMWNNKINHELWYFILVYISNMYTAQVHNYKFVVHELNSQIWCFRQRQCLPLPQLNNVVKKRNIVYSTWQILKSVCWGTRK